MNKSTYITSDQPTWGWLSTKFKSYFIDGKGEISYKDGIKYLTTQNPSYLFINLFIFNQFCF